MEKNRLESFSDGVLAIIITIMVLQLGVPSSAELSAIYPVIPVFLGYVLSFMYVGIYWNNHHHLIKAVHTVSGRILLVNLVFLALPPVCSPALRRAVSGAGASFPRFRVSVPA